MTEQKKKYTAAMDRSALRREAKNWIGDNQLEIAEWVQLAQNVPWGIIDSLTDVLEQVVTESFEAGHEEATIALTNRCEQAEGNVAVLKVMLAEEEAVVKELTAFADTGPLARDSIGAFIGRIRSRFRECIGQ